MRNISGAFLTTLLSLSFLFCAEVFTIGGNSLGSPCQFPFKYGEKWFAECTLEGRSDGHLWCATVTDYDKDKKWGFCPTKCKTAVIYLQYILRENEIFVNKENVTIDTVCYLLGYVWGMKW